MESPQPMVQAKRFKPGDVINFLKEHRFDYLFLFLIGAAIVALDQWTKYMVRTNMQPGSDWLPQGLAWLEPYARVRYWYNSGAAFGIFQNGNLVFTILAIIVILLIIYYFPRTEKNDWWLRLAMAMQFAGAAGNLIDRLFFAHVTDFISVGNFAIFNVADASISVGVAVLLLGVWLKERAEKKQAETGSLQGDEAHEPVEGTSTTGEDEAKGGRQG
jgi:signal peptidase II